jgi:pyruvate kinase
MWQVEKPRKTKIVCTLGPKCWSEEGLDKLLDAGMNVARFNFSHGDHAAHQEVLDRLRKVAAMKGSTVGYLLDTKGPEIRTAMLKCVPCCFLDPEVGKTGMATKREVREAEGERS